MEQSYPIDVIVALGSYPISWGRASGFVNLPVREGEALRPPPDPATRLLFAECETHFVILRNAAFPAQPCSPISWERSWG